MTDVNGTLAGLDISKLPNNISCEVIWSYGTKMKDKIKRDGTTMGQVRVETGTGSKAETACLPRPQILKRWIRSLSKNMLLV